jgi:hypothetical protein
MDRDMSEEDERLEAEHFADVLVAFVRYKETTTLLTDRQACLSGVNCSSMTTSDVDRWKESLARLRPEDAALLPIAGEPLLDSCSQQ